MPYLTTSVAADECGISIDYMRDLIDAGLVPGTKKNGNRRQAPYSAVQAIAALPAVDLSVFTAPEIAVLRVAQAEKPDPSEASWPAPVRSWLGFHASLAPPDLLEALNRWWRGDSGRISAGTYLPVTVGSFCVAVLAGLTGAIPYGAGTERRQYFPNARLLGHVVDLASAKVHFATGLSAQDKAAAHAVLARRLDSTSGGPIAYVS